MSSIGIIVVTHNSSKFLGRCIGGIDSQTLPPDAVVIVDSGSTDPGYLRALSHRPNYSLLLRKNIGFCAANNLGWRECQTLDYILLLNPDAFLPPDFLANALDFMDRSANLDVGAISGVLLGYDIDKDQPTGLIDSTGIDQRWYGRLHDRDQRSPVANLARYHLPEPANALCGALMLCRNKALREVCTSGELFDPTFFMYKEDIDLSWRLKASGWKILFHPDLWAYHCRGWKGRHNVSKAARVMSSRNELRLFKKHRSPYLLYALFKYPIVQLLGI
ncbi:glycosyltransferase family 2 protein [Acidipila rosea]|uniref:GT2 family glycosyltransferase n=1 Tax=Acidipila rosea TaxID=768535 RepID=A0A4R1KZ55_9BACT|nr:glycosyltransferase family 2 protein [Acidipila rosea]MBW4028360.1 glycosyltransferase family 2 protein [Acidobacteriota bacterium]MBW4046264.1 glycosyltransferase family 2 protein [Acidobacteriota bacterium]TCK70826.1 GT2 family glycosyltransferase [Acidipila rosea]